MFSQDGGRTVLEVSGNGMLLPATNQRGAKMTPHQDQRRTTMDTMNASLFIDKVGAVIINTALLAALPTALVAILVQAF